ncbi:MAG: precorrin-2 C(20)-methyltransferase [Cyanobacteria bacterium P01_A01_bin.3]
MAIGTLWGVSVGPGNPDWMTVEGIRAIQSVGAIACPQDRQGKPGMAYRIAQQYVGERPVISLDLPFVTDADVLERSWQAAAKQLVPILQQGSDVAFICEGDASFFSTFAYLAREVRQQEAGVGVQVLPGVCSPLAAAAALSIPLSMWDEGVAIVPAVHRVDELDAILDWADVVVLMKLSSVFDRVYATLERRSLLAHTGLVEWLGWPQQQAFHSLNNMQDYRPPYFSIAIVRNPLKRFPG